MVSANTYFITFSTYGTWLHGSEKGSVDRQRNQIDFPLISPDPSLVNRRRNSMRQEEYVLDEPRRQIVLVTICEVCQFRSWKLWALHVRSNHVHVVVSSTSRPEKVMMDLKAWCSRRIREQWSEDPNRDRWAQHGSTRWLNDDESRDRAIAYVLHEQGEPMSCFDGTNHPDT